MRRTSTTKEQEILEKQRQLAARLQQQGGHQPASGGSSAAGRAPKRPSSAKPKHSPLPSSLQSSKPRSGSASGAADAAAAAAAGNTKKLAIDLTKTSPASIIASDQASRPPAGSAPTQLKRATKKRPVLSSAALVAAARAKAASAAAPKAGKDIDSGSAGGSRSDDVVLDRAEAAGDGGGGSSKAAAAAPKGSPRLVKRKIAGTKPGSLLLASLVAETADTTAAAFGAASSSALPTIKPDDFWKHLRDWDFVGQYFKTMNAQKDTVAEDDSKPSGTQKSVPDTFLNPRHYTAVWAPLCLAECRAQILQEVSAPRSGGQRLPLVPVLVKPTTSRVKSSRAVNNSKGLMYDEDQPWLLGNETGVYVVLETKDQQHDRDWSFSANELVLLVLPQYKDLLQDIGSGRAVRTSETDFSDCAMVGHVEKGRLVFLYLVLLFDFRLQGTRQ